MSPRRPSGQDHRNQMSPLQNLTLLRPRFKLLILSGQRRMKLFQHTMSPSKYCNADIKPPSIISSWCKAALTQFALLKALYKCCICMFRSSFDVKCPESSAKTHVQHVTMACFIMLVQALIAAFLLRCLSTVLRLFRIKISNDCH